MLLCCPNPPAIPWFVPAAIRPASAGGVPPPDICGKQDVPQEARGDIGENKVVAPFAPTMFEGGLKGDCAIGALKAGAIVAIRAIVSDSCGKPTLGGIRQSIGIADC
eukprot:scaffold24769_cov101-Isochrysis_galbana.AAC.2